MGKAVYKLATVFIIFFFLFYWRINIPLAISKNGEQNRFAATFPFFNKLFGHAWNFFSGVLYSNDRMYCMIRDSQTHTATDTLEMMEDIELQKQYHAPFNQKENIIDHLVSHNILIVENGIARYKKQLKQMSPSATDSTLNADAVSMIRNNKYYGRALGTLENYCKMIIVKKGIDTTGKEFKIVMAAKTIRPFAQRDNAKYVSTETIYFETTYNRFSR